MALITPENKKQVVIIIVAVIAGLVASALVGNYVSSKVNEETRKLSYQYEKVQKQKDQLYQEQMAGLQQQIAAVEQKAKKAAEDAAQAASQRATQAAAAQAGVAKKKPSLALRTPEGKRAITVQIESLDAVGGLLNPGDFVDVIAKLNIPTGKKEGVKEPAKENVTAMIFQNLQVLAVNTNIDDPGAYDAQQKEKQLKVTFAVDPQEAGLLSFAGDNGKLELALRTPSEKGRSMLPTASWSTLAEYVLENSGADIHAPDAKKDEDAQQGKMKVETENAQETKPYIQIYRGGREL